MTAKQLIKILEQFNGSDNVYIFTSRYCGGGDEWESAGDTPVVLTRADGGVYLTPDFEEAVALKQLEPSMKVG